MKVVFDTSSLVSLARYYAPFDKNEVLSAYFKMKLQTGKFIITDKVFEECNYVSSSIVFKQFPFLKEKDFLKSAKLPYKTNDLLAPSPAKFIRQVENQFTINEVRKRLGITEVQYENQKNSFLNGADAKQIVLCLHLQNTTDSLYLVTEESEYSNDNKLFKKIPAICKELQIATLTLPELLSKHEEISIDYVIK